MARPRCRPSATSRCRCCVPAILVAMLFRYIFAFRLFSEVWLMTQGGPARSTEVVAVYLYLEAFRYNAFGTAAATGWIMVVVSLLLASVYLWRLRREMLADAALSRARWHRLGKAVAVAGDALLVAGADRLHRRVVVQAERATSSPCRRGSCSRRRSSTTSSSGRSWRELLHGPAQQLASSPPAPRCSPSSQARSPATPIRAIAAAAMARHRAVAGRACG